MKFFGKFSLAVLTLLPLDSFAQAAGNEPFQLRSLPLMVMYGGTVVVVIVAIQAGFILGRRRLQALGSLPESTVTPVSGALMGLLAFILAFTFNVSMNRFEMRKALYLEQIDILENSFRRADLLPDRYRTVIQADLIQLTDLRVASIGHPEKIMDGIVRSDEIHNNLWKVLAEMNRDSTVSPVQFSIMANSLTDITVVHNKRVVVTTIYHLANALWGALFVLVVMAMTCMGYMFGMTSRINWTLVLILSFSFSVVIILIADIDRSGGGAQSIIKFNQQAMIDLRERLGGLSH